MHGSGDGADDEQRAARVKGCWEKGRLVSLVKNLVAELNEMGAEPRQLANSRLDSAPDTVVHPDVVERTLLGACDTSRQCLPWVMRRSADRVP